MTLLALRVCLPLACWLIWFLWGLNLHRFLDDRLTGLIEALRHCDWPREATDSRKACRVVLQSLPLSWQSFVWV